MITKNNARIIRFTHIKDMNIYLNLKLFYINNDRKKRIIYYNIINLVIIILYTNRYCQMKQEIMYNKFVRRLYEGFKDFIILHISTEKSINQPNEGANINNIYYLFIIYIFFSPFSGNFTGFIKY